MAFNYGDDLRRQERAMEDRKHDLEARKREYPLTPDEAYLKPEPALKYILNGDQKKAYDWLVPFCTTRGQYRKVLLGGYAGTGKTFVINRVVEEVKRLFPGVGIGMTAPTHKAVRNLKKHSELKDVLDFGTIHSFLGLKQKMKDDPRNKAKMVVIYELDWDSKDARRIDSIEILIVDEASMLDDKLYGHIEDAVANMPKLKVIFMGDELQIPPVGNKEDGTPYIYSIPFSEAQRSSRKIYYLQLNEIVRQGMDNPIIAYSVAIREQIKHQSVIHEFKHTEDQGVEVISAYGNLELVRDLFRRYFCTEQFKADSDYIKVIVWRRATAAHFSKEIRLLINNVDTLPFIIDGDRLVMNEVMLKGKKILIANNEELIVLSHTIEEVPVSYKLFNLDQSVFDQATANEPRARVIETTFKVYNCKVNISGEREMNVNIIHEDSWRERDQILEKTLECAKKLTDQFERGSMWKQFYTFLNPFAQVVYNYCITAHKSQGSTYDYCISMEWDIDANFTFFERNRIRYVAATRARNKLFIIRP